VDAVTRPDANLDALDPYLYVVRSADTEDGCKALMATNRPGPPPIALPVCPQPGSPQAYAGYDTVWVGVVLHGAAISLADLGPLQPKVEVRSHGARVDLPPLTPQPAPPGVLHLVAAFQLAKPTPDVQLTALLGPRRFAIGAPLQVIAYPEPFWLTVP